MTSSIDFSSVVQAWDRAGEAHIHPLWDRSQEEYWASGRFQAGEVADYAKAGDTVVDFGCGNGRLTIPLAEAGYDVVAVDSSPTMLQRLKSHASQPGAQPKFRTLQSDGSDLAQKLGKKKADVIVARAVLIHHDYASVEKIVTDLAKALKKGGHLIADWPVGEKPAERDSWIAVTTWKAPQRLAVAKRAGLSPVRVGIDPSVWQKI